MLLLKKIGPPSAQATKVANAKAAEHDVKKLAFRLGSGLITAGMLNLMKYVFMNFHEIEADLYLNQNYATSLLPEDLSDYCSLPLSRLETLNNADSYALIQRRSSDNVRLTSALALFDEILPTVGYDDRSRSNTKECHYLARDLHRNKRNIMSTNQSRIGYCTVSNF